MSNQEIEVAARALSAGAVVAFPTETVYGLGVDAENESAVARMYKVKGRPAYHPVIVHIAGIEDLTYWATELPEYASKLGERFWPGPITLLLRRTGAAKDFITGGQEIVGLRIPSHPMALELLRAFRARGGHGVAAPSANRFGEVSPTSAAHVRSDLGPYLVDGDLILDGGECEVGVESTIVDCTRNLPRILRLGAITEAMITEVSPVDPDDDLAEIRVSGSLLRHYSPRAHVITDRSPVAGEGFIALANITTPAGVHRLAEPKTIEDFARTLYSALRSADTAKLETVVINLPEGDGLAAAIRDRAIRASAIE
jgi:L-threonylcarbamoyladenylate synthase